MAEMWKAGRGHLLLVARTHSSLCSITLNHQPPRVCSSASWHCSICPRRFGSPRGDFVTDTSGWGGEGQGVRHEGVEEMSVAIEKVPRMGWGSPIYVPAEEMVLHKHVLHPFLQWLLLLLLQDDTETQVSAPHPEKDSKGEVVSAGRA